MYENNMQVIIKEAGKETRIYPLYPSQRRKFRTAEPEQGNADSQPYQ